MKSSCPTRFEIDIESCFHNQHEVNYNVAWSIKLTLFCCGCENNVVWQTWTSA